MSLREKVEDRSGVVVVYLIEVASANGQFFVHSWASSCRGLEHTLVAG